MHPDRLGLGRSVFRWLARPLNGFHSHTVAERRRLRPQWAALPKSASIVVNRGESAAAVGLMHSALHAEKRESLDPLRRESLYPAEAAVGAVGFRRFLFWAGALLSLPRFTLSFA